MSSGKIKRKLTTIFCADVQSYSTLMADDEADTLQRLQRYRAIMADLFERHEGRKVNTWGDAVIAEFASVVEAVRCAVEIQDAMGAENRDLPPARQMWFRIGINLGDVMQDGSDLYGDGVNVAARLESIAEDAVFSVPKSLTFGSLALGATPWQTLTRVVILTASPGIFSALMIGLGRAVGETMIVLMATGNTPIMDMNIFQGLRTLAANVAVEMPESEVGSTHYRVLFLSALVLLSFTFVMNTLAELIRTRLRKKYASL